MTSSVTTSHGPLPKLLPPDARGSPSHLIQYLGRCWTLDRRVQRARLCRLASTRNACSQSLVSIQLAIPQTILSHPVFGTYHTTLIS